MTITKKINAFINDHTLIGKDQTIVIGLSGGPDSVFLLHYLAELQKELNLTLVAAHLDHEWRSNSDDDVAFCKELATTLNIPFVSKRLSELAIELKPTGSKEDIARTARRFFLQEVAQRYNADAIALAHHQEDQQETFFIRLLRGASLSGLCGIWPKYDLYIRPLLTCSKQELVAWLDAHNHSYLIDPSNEDEAFLRNRLRRKLLPMLREIDDRWDHNFAKAIDHLQQSDQLLEKVSLYAFNQIAQLNEQKTGYSLDITGLLSLEPAMQYRILVHWFTKQKIPFSVSQGFFDEILRFCKHSCCNKEHAIHPKWKLRMHKDRLHIIAVDAS